MNSTHIEVFFQFFIGYITVQCSWKRLVNIVINLSMIVSVNSRIQHYQENKKPYFVMLCDKTRSFIQAFDQWFVFCFLNHSVKYKDHCRQCGNTADNADDNTFCHNDTHITSKCKCHNTQSKESGNRSNRASGYRFKCICNRMCHRTVFAIVFFLIIFKGVQKENGIVHCYT